MQAGKSCLVAAGDLVPDLPAAAQSASMVYAEGAGRTYFSAWDPTSLPDGGELAEYVMVHTRQSRPRPFAIMPAALRHFALEVWGRTLCVYGGVLGGGESAQTNRYVYALSLDGGVRQWRIVCRALPTDRVQIVNGEVWSVGTLSGKSRWIGPVG